LGYKIILQRSAAADIREYTQYLLRRSSSIEVAANWLDKLEILIASLAEQPQRFAEVPEQSAFDISIRHVVHYSHRVVYHVDELSQTVHMLRIYHGSKQPLTTADAIVDMPE